MLGISGALVFGLFSSASPQLQDTAFWVLAPHRYAALAERVPPAQADAATLASLVGTANDVLGQLDLDGVVTSRVKSLVSTAAKMDRKGIDLYGVADRLAVRVRVDREADCYAVLDALHSRYHPVSGEFDDYVAQPKASGYRSLHTALRVPTADGGTTLAEVQIRTHAMHADAETGSAAHWRYKLEQLPA